MKIFSIIFFLSWLLVWFFVGGLALQCLGRRGCAHAQRKFTQSSHRESERARRLVSRARGRQWGFLRRVCVCASRCVCMMGNNYTVASRVAFPEPATSRVYAYLPLYTHRTHEYIFARTYNTKYASVSVYGIVVGIVITLASPGWCLLPANERNDTRQVFQARRLSSLCALYIFFSPSVRLPSYLGII